MNLWKKPKIKKVKNLLISKEEVRMVRATLEDKTEHDFREFAKARQWRWFFNELRKI